MNNKKLNHILHLRLNEEISFRLDTLADKLGISSSDLARSIINNQLLSIDLNDDKLSLGLVSVLDTTLKKKKDKSLS